MQNKYVPALKISLAFLALALPLLVLKSYSDQVQLIQNKAGERRALREERVRLAAEVAVELLGERAGAYVLGRRGTGPFAPLGLDDGLLPGLISGQTPPQPNHLALLAAPGTFGSGFPRRIAGLLELLAADAALQGVDLERAVQVLREIHRGEGLANSRLAYILERLPPRFAAVFADHRAFLELPVEDGRIWIKTSDGEGERLQPVAPADLDAVNQRLAGLGLGLQLAAQAQWFDLDGARTNLDWRFEEPTGDLRNARLWALFLVVVLESALLLLALAVNRYARMAEMQNQLLAVTTHELRTPLAVIGQFGELLAGLESEPRRREYVHHIRRAGFIMQDVVENLLETARFERFHGGCNPAELDLWVFMNNVVTRMDLVGPHPVRLRSCPRVEVWWDGSQMERVLINLIRNAQLHGDSPVELSADVLDEDIFITVRDRGSATTTLPKPGRFRRGSSHGAGLGLGLYLCDKVVSVHEGKLAFRPANPGLAVELILPREVTTKGEVR